MDLQSSLLIVNLAIYLHAGYLSMPWLCICVTFLAQRKKWWSVVYYIKTMAMIHLALGCCEVRGVKQFVGMQLGEQIDCYWGYILSAVQEILWTITVTMFCMALGHCNQWPVLWPVQSTTFCNILVCLRVHWTTFDRHRNTHWFKVMMHGVPPVAIICRGCYRIVESMGTGRWFMTRSVLLGHYGTIGEG